MRQQFEIWLNHVWYERAKPPAWLQAVTPLYRLGYALDRKIRLARRPATLVGRPIIVVGNITAGGSGKTPLVIRLCRVLQQAGLQPGVVSRGFRRRQRGLTRVTRTSTAAETGDEPLVIANRAHVPVVVAADRCAAAQSLFDSGVDVVIADDGLQHHRLPRSIEICVVDGSRAFGNRWLLPAGPLREPVERLRNVDFVVVNGPECIAADVGDAVPMQLIPGLLYALDGEVSWRLSQFAGCRVNAVAGIANPQAFFQTLQHAGLQVSPFAFGDHHHYTPEDFRAMETGMPIIMTEKDAVKCRSLHLDNAWYLAIEASLPSDWEFELLDKLERSVTRDGGA